MMPKRPDVSHLNTLKTRNEIFIPAIQQHQQLDLCPGVRGAKEKGYQDSQPGGPSWQLSEPKQMSAPLGLGRLILQRSGRRA